jgi:hypothetical protein
MRTERELRLYAQHLALMVSKRGEGPYTLSHRYGDKKLIGSHRTLRSLERGIVRYHDQELVKMGVRL